MKPILFILFLTSMVSCSKEHYEDLTSKIKPALMEAHTLSVRQENKRIIIRLTANAQAYERRADIELTFNNHYKIGHVIFFPPNTTEITTSPFSSEGTLTGYVLRHFSRYNP